MHVEACRIIAYLDVCGVTRTHLNEHMQIAYNVKSDFSGAGLASERRVKMTML